MATDIGPFRFTGTPTDPNSVWDNESWLVDGSTASGASTTTPGSSVSNYIDSVGTNAPSSGPALANVALFWRYNYSVTASISVSVRITNPGFGSTTAISTLSPGVGLWSDWLGGVVVGSYAQAQNLQVRAWKNTAGADQFNLNEVEFYLASADSVAIGNLGTPPSGYDVYGPFTYGVENTSNRFNGATADPGAVWNNDANFTDTSTGTYADTTSTGTVSSNYLQATGNLTPTSFDGASTLWALVIRLTAGTDTTSTNGGFALLNASDTVLASRTFTTTLTAGQSIDLLVDMYGLGYTFADISTFKIRVWRTGGNGLRAMRADVQTVIHDRVDKMAVVGMNSAGTTINGVDSTDGGTTWQDQAAANPPSFNGVRSIAAVQRGAFIHIMTQDDYVAPVGMTAGSHSVDYHLYCPGVSSTLRWVITNEAVMTTTLDRTVTVWYPGGIAVRSDGDVIVTHIGNTFANMGGDWHDAVYSRRESGSWTTNVTLDVQNNIDYAPLGPGSVVIGTSDNAHIYHGGSTAGWGATLDSANNLSTGASQTFSGERFGLQAHSWNNGSSQYIAHTASYVGTPTAGLRRNIENASGDIADSGTSLDPSGTFPTGGIVAAYDSTNSDLYAVWNEIDEIYMAGSSNDGGSWNTPSRTLIEDQEDSNEWVVLGATIFTHSAGNGGDYVLGVLLQQGTTSTIHYDEYVITSGSTGQTIAVGVANE